MIEHDEQFACMGTIVRLVIGDEAGDARQAAASARRRLEDFDRRLSRFHADSELCALNADPRSAVPSSALLCDAVAAALWGAERTGGLVDPSTGTPAWTGLVGATALAPRGLEADVLAKAAVLSGPAGAREMLRRHGGFLFHDDGRIEGIAIPIPRDLLRTFTGART
jgi:thiamine biosynthesis lipoprotein ApbE